MPKKVQSHEEYLATREFRAELDADSVWIKAGFNQRSGFKIYQMMRIPREQWDRIVREYQAGER